MSMVIPGTDAASTCLTAVVLDGSLASTLAQAGLGVSVALLEAVEVSVGPPQCLAPMITESRPELAVVAWIGVFGETVETFGAAMGVLVEIADTSGSSSEDDLSSGSIRSDLVADGMSVQLSVLTGPEVFGDPVLVHATAALRLSGVECGGLRRGRRRHLDREGGQSGWGVGGRREHHLCG